MTSSVSVTVQSTATTLVVTPLSTTVATGSTQAFTGSLQDQFGLAVASQPTLTWTINGSQSISSSGLFTAGTSPGGPYMLTASGGGFTGHASVTVTNTPPSIATPAAATPNPVSGTTSALSILGQSVHGESTLSYTWSTIGSPPASVSFSPNGSNASKASTATFSTSGSYVLQCLVADGLGGTATSSVAVTVSQTLSTISITPSSASVPLSGTTMFVATSNDQFGKALVPQPTLGWIVTGPGSIDGFGTFIGATIAGGPYTVTASDGSVSGTATVTVITAAPTIVTAASAASNPVTGTTVGLTVQGADDAGPGSLIYTWSATGTPAGPVTFSPNSTNAAQATTATFSALGTYSLQCVITDPANLSVTSAVSVVVAPTASTIAVSPATAVSQLNGTSVVYSAIVADQFGAPLVTQPTVSWLVPSAAGSINAAGQVIAAGTPGGPFSVTASSGNASGTALITVINTPPTLAAPASASVDPSGITASLSVLGADDGGPAALTYTWSLTGSAPGAVGFAPNGTNAAQVSTAIFSVPGIYTLQVVIADAQNLSVTSQVAVTIGQAIAPLIGTIAGAQGGGYAGDGGPALLAELNTPNGLAVDSNGNIYIADWFTNRIRFVSAGTDMMSTVIGTGDYSSTGDGGPASVATIDQPSGVALDAHGNLYLSEFGGNRIRQVDLTTGIITTIAGTGAEGYTGDGGLAINATLTLPRSLACDAAGNVYVPDFINGVIRRIDASSGIITTIAGPGGGPASGDGGPASTATFNGPIAVAIDLHGNIFVAEYYSSLVRRIDASTSIISTIASSSSSPALVNPNGISCDAIGNIFVSSFTNDIIMRIDASTGATTTFAGSGAGGFGGDGGPAITAMINGPSGSGFDAQGAFYFCDRSNDAIRIVTTGPVIETPAAATPNPVTTTSTTLTVLGAASEGESILSYNWSTLGSPPAPVQFSANGTNTAKTTTATFTAAGTYLFEVTVSDGYGRTAVSPVQVSVVRTPVTPIAISPTQSTIPINGFQQYTATVGPDQFGVPFTYPFTWVTSGGGYVYPNGFYAAYATPGTYTVSAYFGSVPATATITVVNRAPTFAIAANANPNPVTGIGTRLAAFGSSVGGESLLTYAWSVVGTPPAPVTLGVNIGTNGTNAAKITSVKFKAAGTYIFQVTATDSFGLSASSQVSVTVVSTLTSIGLAPNPMYVDPGANRTFTPSGLDQFGLPMPLVAPVTWALTDSLGLGSLSSQGVFAATMTPGGRRECSGASGLPGSAGT